jgi:hypothetical protein
MSLSGFLGEFLFPLSLGWIKWEVGGAAVTIRSGNTGDLAVAL